MKIEQRGCTVVVTVPTAVGRNYEFTHSRSTEVDAENLLFAIRSEMNRRAESSEQAAKNLHACIDHLRRQNAALRGHLRRAKKGANHGS